MVACCVQAADVLDLLMQVDDGFSLLFGPDVTSL